MGQFRDRMGNGQSHGQNGKFYVGNSISNKNQPKNFKILKKSKIARLILLVLYEWTVEMLVKFQVNCLESFTTYNSSQTLVTNNLSLHLHLCQGSNQYHYH